MKTLLLQDLYMNVTGTTFRHIYIKGTTYYTNSILDAGAVQPLPRISLPAPWVDFRGNSCTCLSPLCRCSPGHTWHSLEGSRDSSLERLGDGQVSHGSSLPCLSYPLEDIGNETPVAGKPWAGRWETVRFESRRNLRGPPGPSEPQTRSGRFKGHSHNRNMIRSQGSCRQPKAFPSSSLDWTEPIPQSPCCSKYHGYPYCLVGCSPG